MSYLEQLKAKKAENPHPGVLTKPTQGASGSFVSAPGWPVSENEGAKAPATLTYEARACAHESHFPPMPTESPVWQCRDCPHCWSVPCGCGTASWRPDASGAVVVWTCRGCGQMYGSETTGGEADETGHTGERALAPPEEREAHVPAPVTLPLSPWESTPGTCYVCGGTRRWQSIYGVTICAGCHPPGDPALVATWKE